MNAETKAWWSFQPVQRPELPSVKNAQWVSMPIDQFILARLESRGLTPAVEASQQALMRRVYYDVIGLPPTPEETTAFLVDESPNAYEKLVDRLLASPLYGEKWARHWLDVVRYGESNSYERDATKPHVWRYRDYVIRALNEDKPYDQFVREQLAGDEMPEELPEAIIATGFYRLGIWQDEPVDIEESLYNDLDDILVTSSEAFLGLTIGCARCHDHKIDPVPQRDYYRLLAFFRNVHRYGGRSPENTVIAQSVRNVGTATERQERRRHQQTIEPINTQLERIESLVRDEFTDVEREDFKHEMNRAGILENHLGEKLTENDLALYRDLMRRRAEIQRNTPPALAKALCVTEQGREAPETFLLVRGNAHSPGDRVSPGFPAVLSPPEPVIVPPASHINSTGRRTALARWITARENPLTARVMVNRIWHHHFGQGIVRSTNDFGFQGTPPTHPRLLDWLASEFVEVGWRWKPIHKTILLSSTYRMSSQGTADSHLKDEANNWLSRFRLRRLLAEEVRDSVLSVNHSLDLTMYGPSIYPTLSPEVLHGQSQPGANWLTSPLAQQNRRSLYIHVKRSLPVPMMASFDMPESDKSCPVRFVTTQPTQALGMLNGDFTNRQSEVFADDARRLAGSDTAKQIELILSRTCQRRPSESEIQRGVGLMHWLENQQNVSAENALRYFCLLALNLNEFIYLD